MSKIDDIADKVLQSIGNDQHKAREITDALVSKDPRKIEEVLTRVANIKLTKEDVDALVAEMKANPKKVAAFGT